VKDLIIYLIFIMLTTKRRSPRLSGRSNRLSSSNMKKISIGPLLTIIVLVILVASYVYMAYQVNSQQKKLNTLQITIAQDTQTVSGVVNFINASLTDTQAAQ